MVWGSEVATHVATAESARTPLTLRAAEALGTALLGALRALHLALLAEDAGELLGCECLAELLVVLAVDGKAALHVSNLLLLALEVALDALLGLLVGELFLAVGAPLHLALSLLALAVFAAQFLLVGLVLLDEFRLGVVFQFEVLGQACGLLFGHFLAHLLAVGIGGALGVG